MTFHHPSVWLLCLLGLLPVALFIRWWQRSAMVVEFSSLWNVVRAGTTWRVWMRWIVPTLRFIGLGLLIVALARPQEGNEQTRVRRDGIAIQLVVDRSGSMRATDFQLDGHEADRLTVAKKIMQEFVTGGEDLPGRPDDLIGVIQFASFVDSICPITLDHSHVVNVIQQTKPATQEEGMGTAIGDAVALGVERLAGLSRRKDLMSEGEIKSRIMILLTDGENSAGDIEPLTAAEMAAAYGIKVYTIGAGSEGGVARVPIEGFGGRTQIATIRVSIDEDTLKKMAEMTGGRYFRAKDEESLREIYKTIDSLERTKMEQQRFMTYREAAVEPVHIGEWKIPAIALMALVALGLEQLLSWTVFRTVGEA